MTLRDRLFCWWHHICAKHRAPKEFICGPSGKGWWRCEKCMNEFHEQFNQRLKDMGIL